MMNLEEYILDDYHRPETCKICGAMMSFKGVGEYECIKCHALDYDDYGVVRRYLEEHPGATITETAEVTGISQNAITQMLRQERLEIREGSKTYLKCVSCGKPIRSGKYCTECGRIAAAAENRRKKESKLEDKKKNVQGIGKVSEGEAGKQRFNWNR